MKFRIKLNTDLANKANPETGKLSPLFNRLDPESRNKGECHK